MPPLGPRNRRAVARANAPAYRRRQTQVRRRQVRVVRRAAPAVPRLAVRVHRAEHVRRRTQHRRVKQERHAVRVVRRNAKAVNKPAARIRRQRIASARRHAQIRHSMEGPRHGRFTRRELHRFNLANARATIAAANRASRSSSGLPGALNALVRLTGHDAASQLHRYANPSATERAIAHPGRTLRGLQRFSSERNLQSAVPGYRAKGIPHINPAKTGYAGYVVLREASHGNFHPAAQTAKNLGIYIATAPAGIAQLAADPVGAYTSFSKDTNRRSGQSYKQIEHRVKKHGAAPEVVDATLFGTPSAVGLGRGATRAAESGVLGEKARRFATEPRPELRESGNSTRHQHLGRNMIRLAAQRGEDAMRARRLEKRNTKAARHGRGKPGLQPLAKNRDEAIVHAGRSKRHHLQRAERARQAGDKRGEWEATREALRADAQLQRAKRRRANARPEVVPVKANRAIRIRSSEVQSRRQQQFKTRQTEEVTGLHGARTAVARLNKHERLAATFAVKGGMPLDKARAVPWLERVRAQMLAEHKATGREGTPQGVAQIDDLIRHADKAFTDRLRTFQKGEVARIRRIEATDRELRPETAMAAARRSQQVALEAQGVHVEHPYDPLIAEFESGGRKRAFSQAKRERARATGRVRAAERRLATAQKHEAYRQGRATRDPKQRELAGLERAGGRTLEASKRVDRAREHLHAADKKVTETRRAKGPTAKRALQHRKGELDREFAALMDAAAEHAGLPEAGYVKDFKHRGQVESRSPTAMGGAKAAPNLKRSRQALIRTGRADLSPQALLQSVNESIKRQANHALIEEQASVHALPAPAPEEIRAALGRDVKPERLTTDHWRQLLEARGYDTADWVAWSPGAFRDAIRRSEEGDAAAVGKGASEQSTEAFDAAVREAFAPGPNVQGVQMIPREAWREIADRRSGSIGRVLDKFQGTQSGLILGFSPKWAQFQVAANAFLAGFSTRGNPLAFVKAPRAWQQAFSPEVRGYAEEMFGTGAGRAQSQRVHIGAGIDDSGLLGWTRAWREAQGIRYKHMKDKVPLARHLDGNPLFQLDAEQNAYFKKVVFTDEVKRQAFRQMQRESGFLNTALARLHHTFTLGPKEQMARIVENPELLDDVLRHTDNVLGNYTRYTALERTGIRHFVLFYGFMRYALRTAFYTAPVHHPLMTSIVLKLDQLHKQEVDRLVGGEGAPWAYGRIFFSSHSPAGILGFGEKVPGSKDLYSVDVGRMSPTQNVVTDIGTEGPKALGSALMSPLVQTFANTFLYKKDLFTGQNIRLKGSTEDARSIPFSSGLRIVGNDLLATSAPVREYERATQPYATTPDTLPWDPMPIRHKERDKNGRRLPLGIAYNRKQDRRAKEEGSRSLLDRVLGATVAPYPVRDNTRDVIRAQKLFENRGKTKKKNTNPVLDEFDRFQKRSSGGAVEDFDNWLKR